MLDLESLSSQLQKPNESALSVLDPRVDEIISLVEKEELLQAGEQVQQLFVEGFFDIRLMMYYYYACFLEREIEGLYDIFHSLNEVLSKHWDHLAPEKKREKHTANALNWFLTRLSKALEYQEEKQGPLWQKALVTMQASHFDSLLEETSTLREWASATLEASHLDDRCMRLTQWLGDFRRVVVEQEGVEDSPKEEASSNEPSTTTPKATSPIVGDTVELSLSPAMKHLLRKLEAFSTLVAREEYGKASLVADDLSQTIAHFDPRVYLPSLFSPYFQLLATHVETFAESWEEKETLAWQSLEELYKVDLDAFMQWKR